MISAYSSKVQISMVWRISEFVSVACVSSQTAFPQASCRLIRCLSDRPPLHCRCATLHCTINFDSCWSPTKILIYLLFTFIVLRLEHNTKRRFRSNKFDHREMWVAKGSENLEMQMFAWNLFIGQGPSWRSAPYHQSHIDKDFLTQIFIHPDSKQVAYLSCHDRCYIEWPVKQNRKFQTFALIMKLVTILNSPTLEE